MMCAVGGPFPTGRRTTPHVCRAGYCRSTFNITPTLPANNTPRGGGTDSHLAMSLGLVERKHVHVQPPSAPLLGGPSGLYFCFHLAAPMGGEAHGETLCFVTRRSYDKTTYKSKPYAMRSATHATASVRLLARSRTFPFRPMPTATSQTDAAQTTVKFSPALRSAACWRSSRALLSFRLLFASIRPAPYSQRRRQTSDAPLPPSSSTFHAVDALPRHTWTHTR